MGRVRSPALRIPGPGLSLVSGGEEQIRRGCLSIIQATTWETVLGLVLIHFYLQTGSLATPTMFKIALLNTTDA